MFVTGELPKQIKENTSVALGCFDGLHLGHMAVIDRALASCDGLLGCVFTFSKPGLEEELMPFSVMQHLLMQKRVGLLVRPSFAAIRHLTPEQFVDRVLIGSLRAKRVVCGYNYHFGEGASGDAALLVRLCQERGIAASIIPPVEADGAPVSSTRIRALVRQGEMERAAKLLGRPFVIDFEVVKGQQLGRLMGTPTLNQLLPDGFVRPRFGVYASLAKIGQTYWPAVTNFGVRPTVGADAPLYETWIPHYEGDLYGKRVPVCLLSFMRPEQKFGSIDLLRTRIHLDGVEATKIARRLQPALLLEEETGQ